MRIAITSDIHANYPSLKKFLDKIRFDFWIDLGDCIGYYPFPNEVLKTLEEKCDKNVIGDHGFHCLKQKYSRMNRYAREALIKTREMLNERSLSYLRSLKKKMKFEVDGKSFLMFHGSPRDPLWEYVFPGQKRKIEHFLKKAEVDFLLLGHTHTPFIYRRSELDTTLIQPGSLGQPRDGKPNPSFCLLEGRKPKIKRYSYDISATAREVKEEGFPNFLAERLYKGV